MTTGQAGLIRDNQAVVRVFRGRSASVSIPPSCEPSLESVKVLALETSGWSGSAAILSGRSVVAQAALPEKMRTAVGLAPLVKSLFDEAGWNSADVDLVAVTSGPGSFTGLRVGVTTAKTFAYAAKADVLGVNTLEAIAFGCFFPDGESGEPFVEDSLAVVMDAQRKQFFAADFSRDGDSIDVGEECRIVDAEEWMRALDASKRIAGPGLNMKLADGQTAIEHLQQRGLGVAVPVEHWQLMAVSVGQLAVRQYEAGTRDDMWKLAPQYFRLSAAEEKAAKAANES